MVIYRRENLLVNKLFSCSPNLPTSWVRYHAGKPIESVVYCLNNQTPLDKQGCYMGSLVR